MTATLQIADQRFTFASARLEIHGGDWNLELAAGAQTHWLSGTISPAPETRDDLPSARMRVDLRSLDALVESLIGRPITMYPGGFSVCELSLAPLPSERGIRLATQWSFTWDTYLATFPDRTPPLEASMDIDAELTSP